MTYGEKQEMIHELVNRLIKNHELSKSEYICLLTDMNDIEAERIREEAVRLRKKYYGDKVFVRGLIEFTNYCKNNCYYCGIRRENKETQRYRMTKEEILTCCEEGYELGFSTFVLQGGEDSYYNDDIMVEIIKEIKGRYPECAVTLSMGERSFTSYERLKAAGADRYLLRHETANEAHYNILHPSNMLLSNRKKCLYELKRLGFQTGAGFMVGSPGQTMECIGEDLVFLKELSPHMVGIGPFLPHHQTKFAQSEKGDTDLTLLLLSIVRILLPKVLLPATTALGTADTKGRERGILAGANVVMPNLSPISNRKKYELYNNKISTGEEAAECKEILKKSIASIGYTLVTQRGDAL